MRQCYDHVPHCKLTEERDSFVFQPSMNVAWLSAHVSLEERVVAYIVCMSLGYYNHGCAYMNRFMFTVIMVIV